MKKSINFVVVKRHKKNGTEKVGATGRRRLIFDGIENVGTGFYLGGCTFQ
jgi:hypothetical protein